MESFYDLLPLLFLLVYFLLGRKRRQPQGPAESLPEPQAGEARSGSSFDDFVRQIEEAMREQREASAPPTAEAPPKPAPALPKPAPPPRPTRASPRASPRETAPPPPERRRRTPAALEAPTRPPPRERQRLERPRPELPRAQPSKTAARPLPPADLAAIYAPPPQPSGANAPAPATRWAQRIRQPGTIREAIVLKAIFDGPWQPRKPRRR